MKNREATVYGSAFDQIDLYQDLQHALVTRTSNGTPASMDYRNQTPGSHS